MYEHTRAHTIKHLYAHYCSMKCSLKCIAVTVKKNKQMVQFGILCHIFWAYIFNSVSAQGFERCLM